MPPYPWLSTTFTDQKLVFWSQPQVFRTMGQSDQLPNIISFFGSATKATYLAGIMGYAKPLERHGQIRLTSRPLKAGVPLEILLDCELSLQSSSGLQTNMDSCVQQSVDWLGQLAPELQLEDTTIAYVLTPLSGVMCYFAADFGGIRGVAARLARQAMLPANHNLPNPVYPNILVVTSTRSQVYDTISVQADLRCQIVKQMTAINLQLSSASAEQALDRSFRSIHVVGLRKNQTHMRRVEQLNQRLADLSQDSYWSRRMNRYLFNLGHIEALASRLVHSFCSGKGSFNFIRESRSIDFSEKHLEVHAKELLGLIPDATWLWRVVIPLIASAYCLASYPYGSHSFHSNAIFAEYFKYPTERSISAFTYTVEIQTKFTRCVQEKMDEISRGIEFQAEDNTALSQHVNCLTDLWPHMAELKSFRSCLCCLMFAPEKVLFCGHAICNVCIRRFGSAATAKRHSFVIANCPLCGFIQPTSQRVFRLIPPTAGIRVLCLDGGGIRGVVPLIYLQHLELGLSHLGIPLHELFDYVCGTSAGGLIAMGLFLMQWSPSSCLARFEQLAATTFLGSDPLEKPSLSQKIHRLFHTLVNDHRYNLSPIERAFHSTAFTKMFNPLQTDTKVAVTSTSVRANIPCVISNYNGDPRPKDSNYSHIRAASCHHDMTISDAAACTAAAPFFFKSKDVVHLDTFQDGGLRHNNPALLASWECATLWPEKGQVYEPENCRIDHMVSLGTGSTMSSKHEVGPHSPKRDRFAKRLLGSFMQTMDGEEQWRTFISCIPPELRSRFHRLNVFFEGQEPALDDTTAMNHLKEEASRLILENDQLQCIKDTMIASLFYFEIDGVNRLEGGAYQCCGTILCRAPLEDASRQRLYDWLIETHAFFVVGSQSVPCAPCRPKGNPTFQRSMTFVVANVEKSVSILLTGVTAEATPISGMPAKLRSIMEAQRYDAPFGCIDNRKPEKALPSRPLKRKAREL